MSTSKPVIRSGQVLPYFDGTNDHLIFSREYQNLLSAAVTAFLNLKGLRVSENNSFIEIPSAAAGGGTQRFKITETFDEFNTLADYFAAQQWSDAANDFAGDTIYIAKHFKHRPSLTAETLRGTPVTYTYASNLDRTTSDGVNTPQNEELFPSIEAGNEIFCSKLLTPDKSITVVEDGSHPEWVDITPRLWSRKTTQP